MSILERSDYQQAIKRYNPRRAYYPKRPVKSFLDLEVYQKALEQAVYVCNVIVKPMLSRIVSSRKISEKQALFGAELNISPVSLVLKNMMPCALGIPHLIAEAHSLRFGAGEECLVLLEKVMLNCNKMIVYLEQTRDICATGVEVEQFDEQTKKYLYIRRKVLNLQRSWRKFIEIKKQETK